MVKDIKIYAIVASLLIFSCSAEKETGEGEVVLLEIAPEQSAGVDFSPYLEVEDVFVLRQAENDPVGQIDKIVRQDDRYYVLDKRQAKGLFAYDLSGEPIGRLTKSGRGPGEMQEIVDFDVDDKMITVVSINPSKQVSLNLEGKFLGEVSLDIRPVKFARLPDGSDVYEVSALQNNHYFHWGKNGQIDFSAVSITSESANRNRAKYMTKEGIVKVENKVFCRPTLSSAIYSLDETGAKEAYKLDIGRYTPSYDKFWNDDQDLISYLDYYGSGNSMVLGYHHVKEAVSFTCLLNTQTDEYVFGRLFDQEPKGSLSSLLLIDIAYGAASGYISAIPPGNRLQLWKNQMNSKHLPLPSRQMFTEFETFKAKLDTLDPNDNILVKFRVKGI